MKGMTAQLRPLTARQSAFVTEYMVDLNATQAAIRAGYSERTAQEQAARLLGNAIVAAAIQREMEKRTERVHVDADRTLLELAALAYSDITDVAQWDGDTFRLTPSSELSPQARRSIQSIKVRRNRQVQRDETGAWETETIEVKLWDKVAALDKVMRHLRLFPADNHVTVNIERDQRVTVLMATLNCTRDEALQAIEMAERALASGAVVEGSAEVRE